MTHRIYVDLPDAQNRMKILKILLAKENLESEFGFDELANATEGYSGSDLKVSCSSHPQMFYSSSLRATLSAVHLFHLFVTCLAHFLQNLCVAAAYRPVHELLEEEKKVEFPCFQYYLLHSKFIHRGSFSSCLCSPGYHFLLGVCGQYENFFKVLKAG